MHQIWDWHRRIRFSGEGSSIFNTNVDRNIKLAESDWTQSATDSTLSSDKKTEWATYRQALRDLPANTTDFSNPTWPTKPS